LSTDASGTPSHGITIDQPSTQRRRYTRSSGLRPLSKSPSSSVPGFSQAPSTMHVPGFGAQRLARLRRIGLSAAELVEVVVRGHVS
jgi:hypothetical protein